jgi:hypothetical protein
MKQLPVAGNSCTIPKEIPQSNSLILQGIIEKGFRSLLCCGFQGAVFLFRVQECPNSMPGVENGREKTSAAPTLGTPSSFLAGTGAAE